MRRLFVLVLVLIVTLSLVPAASAEDVAVTIGYLTATTKKDSVTIRGTAPKGMTVAISVNGEVRARVIAGPSMSVYRHDVALDPGENQIVAVVEGTSACAEAAMIRVTKSFKDLNKHFAQEDAEALATLGIANGMGNDEFAPEQPLTRAQFAKLVVLGLRLEPEQNPTLAFADAGAIPEWARGFVATAVARGLIKGFEDGTFRPDEKVSRAQVAVIAARGLRTKGIEKGTEKSPKFKDEGKIPVWARADVEFTGTAGLIGSFWGEEFDADSPATRGLAAVVVRRLYSARKLFASGSTCAIT